jgi:hypothetical protein
LAQDESRAHEAVVVATVDGIVGTGVLLRGEPGALGAEVRAGDALESGRGTVELLLSGSKAGPGTGPRVALGKKARVRLLGADADDEADLVLEEGGLVVLSDDHPVGVRAGRAVLTINGDAELALTRKGALDLMVYTGVVAIAVNGVKHTVNGGKKVRVGADGTLGKVRSLGKRARLPNWLTALHGVLGKRVFHVRLVGELDDYAIKEGTATGEAVRSTGKKGWWAGKIQFKPPGGYALAPGARLRLKLFASAPTNVMMHIYCPQQKDNFFGQEQQIAAGWSFVEWELDAALTKVTKQAIKAGDRGTNLQLFIGGGGPSLTFDLWEILVYVPRKD